MKPKVVIIEPDKRTQRLILGVLNQDYEIFSTKDISDGFQTITMHNPEIIIIDPLYPEKENLNFLKTIKDWCDCYIIAVSENSNENAIVTVLESGADDYIKKPFFSNELKARVMVGVRQIKKLETAKGLNTALYYVNGNFKLDYDARKVTVNNIPLHLTKNEFKILSLLCRHSGKVLTYEYILKSVWGPRAVSSTGILRVNIANLRRKIELHSNNQSYIFTENGIGYSVGENEFKDNA